MASWRVLANRPLVLLAFLGAACATSQHQARPSAPPDGAAEVRAALRAFLDAFENLEWEAFRDSFADDACVFFPSAQTPDRFCGRAAVEARFRRVFDDERRGAASGPPYLQLRPEGLEIQLVGPTAAIASFELRSDKRVARRTFVFRKDGAAWHIAHLHASNVPWPDQAR